MEQFFILQRYRRSGAGRALAKYVLFSHPGAWELGQIANNSAACSFWRQVIGEFTGGKFTELQVTEGWWQWGPGEIIEASRSPSSIGRVFGAVNSMHHARKPNAKVQ